MRIRVRSSVWSAGKLLLLSGGLAATFVVFAVMAMRVALRAREVVVPDLTGRPLEQARVLASDAGLSLRVDDARRPDTQVPVGYVLGQEPRSGAAARRQRGVRVWLSGGARVVVSPNLVGESERAAQIRLAQDNMMASALAEIRDASYPPGVVVAQDPPASTHTAEVRLLVNRGEDRASYVMPDLIGVNGERASDVLRGRGFRVAIVSRQSSPGIPAGVVIRQTPAGGYQVHPGDAISLEVSQ